jgi:hypothetical protein
MEFKIPSLWKDEKILLPQMLSDLYIKKLKDIGMYEHAKNYIRQEKKEGAVGGITHEETIKHFAERFSNSCVRLQKVMIDPKNNFGQVPDYFFSTFSEGNIALLDSPCGTGAGALSLLYVLRELRLTKNLPILPLTINILACDYSDSALDVYKELLGIAEPDLSQVGIKITIKQIKWDAYCIKSTQELMDSFKNISADEYFVLVSAFSGVDEKQLNKLQLSFTHMQGCLSVVPYTLVHVEPNTKKGVKLFNVLQKILKLFSSDRKIEEYKPKPEARFTWVDPTSQRDIVSNVIVSLNSRGV